MLRKNYSPEADPALPVGRRPVNSPDRREGE